MQNQIPSPSFLLLAAGLLLPRAAGVSAQDPAAQTERSKRMSGHVERLVDSPELVRSQIVGLLNAECARVANADEDELYLEDRWLEENLSDLRVRLTAARQQRSRTKEGTTDGMSRALIEELEVKLAIAGLMHEVVGECIRERQERVEATDRQLRERRTAAAKPRTLQVTWKASCTTTPGIEADSAGTMELTFHEGNVTGSVWWSPSQVSLDVKGVYLVDGSLGLSLVRPEAVREFRLVGEWTEGSLGELSASGTIRYANSWETSRAGHEGCNIGPDPSVCIHGYSCQGSWKSQ